MMEACGFCNLLITRSISSSYSFLKKCVLSSLFLLLAPSDLSVGCLAAQDYSRERSKVYCDAGCVSIEVSQ